MATLSQDNRGLDARAAVSARIGKYALDHAESLLMESQSSSTIILQEFLANPKNREAFGKFATKYQARIIAICMAYQLQQADAEDLTAKILLRFFERDVFERFVFQTKTQFNSWLQTVVSRDILTFIRAKGRKPGDWGVGTPANEDPLQWVSDEMVHGLKSLYEEDLARVENARKLVKERVAEKTWKAFCMLVDEERSTKEVAELLNMTKVSVWAARARVLRMLREELSGLFKDN